MRIAFAQLSSESDDFTTRVVDAEFVRRTGYTLRGSEIEEAGAALQNEVGGAVGELRELGASIVGLVAVRANSGGPVDAGLHQELTADILARLSAAGSVDGVVLSLNGSMVTPATDDPDGELVQRVRELVGPRVPIGVTLDLHANITHRLIANADVVTAYKNYPHTDLAETGARAARLIARAARGEIRPATLAARIPWVGSAFNASTRGDGEFAKFARFVRDQIGGDVLDTSLLHVGCWTDVREYGSAVLVVADGDPMQVRPLAQELANRYWAMRNEFNVPTMSVRDAVAASSMTPSGPVLLLDTADTTGGGASGDSVHALSDFLGLETDAPLLATVVDPDAARKCGEAGAGASVSLEIGHHLDPIWGTPITIEARIEWVGEAGFSYSGGLFAGRCVSMGLTAVVTTGPARIVIASNPLYEFADEHFQAVGLNIADYRFVIVKNMMNFREVLAGKASAWYVLDCPGPTPIDYGRLPYRRPLRPLEPFDPVSDPVVHFMTTASPWGDCPDPRRGAIPSSGIQAQAEPVTH